MLNVVHVLDYGAVGDGSTNDYTMVWIDNDGDIEVEMAIRLTGLHLLAASDFLL